MKFQSRIFALSALFLAFASQLVLAHELQDQQRDAQDALLHKRDIDSYKIFSRKRNAHACIMSIVFIVLYPLGAISIHLPIDRIPFLKNTYLRKKVPSIHAPIQLIAFVMMIGATALGIKIGHDLGYLKNPVHAHVVIGLLVVCTIIVFQPVMGALQHRHFKKTGGKSVFGLIHRWVGRGAIILGIINNGLGFQLAENDIEVPKSSYLRNFILAGVLVGIWVGLAVYDQFGSKHSGTAAEEKHKEGTNGIKPVSSSDGEVPA